MESEDATFAESQKPNSTIINSLFAMAACSSKIDEIKACQEEIENEKRIISEAFMFQRKCHQMSYDLEAERKSNAEELRLINQDINHLEDMIKGIKSTHENQRILIKRKYSAFRGELLSTNQICHDCGLANENLIPFDSILIPEWLRDKPNPRLIIPPILPPAAAAIAGPSNPYFSGNPPSFRPPFSNFFFPPSTHQQQHSIIANLHPRPFGTFLEDISKLKDCQSCKQKIHRNAPICPLCKSKNSSKAKKPRKNL